MKNWGAISSTSIRLDTMFKKVDWPTSGYYLHLSLLVDGRIYHSRFKFSVIAAFWKEVEVEMYVFRIRGYLLCPADYGPKRECLVTHEWWELLIKQGTREVDWCQTVPHWALILTSSRAWMQNSSIPPSHSAQNSPEVNNGHVEMIANRTTRIDC